MYIFVQKREAARDSLARLLGIGQEKGKIQMVEQEFREVSAVLKTIVTNQAPRLPESNCKKFADWIATELEKMPEVRGKLKMQKIVKIIYE